ncbi:DNA translocase FtsK [Sandaracinus amylolyticus]|uniref:Cell division protein FtsK n=1 Tax=Sandaracinus amylolyticus TaxID=927083 RepID=A0A0F6W8R3_9BACT|nr:DNA translocase FtsK [Sandaracinus amylolyticus]AKF10356.1 Cell division protein FtsK [Sandaracinus amylolyticus]
MSAHESTIGVLATTEGGRRHEVLGILSGAATTLLALSLYTYDARGGENWIGPVGEWIANIAATAFGAAAWVVPFELSLLTIRLFQRRRSPVGLAHLASTLVIVLVGCAMVHLAMPGEEVLGGHLPGGMFGEVLGEVLRSLLGLVGAFVVGTAVILVTMVLRTSFSIVGAARTVFGGAAAGASAAREWTSSVWEAWQEAREIERREREEEAARNAPRIVVPGASQSEADEELEEEAIAEEDLAPVEPAPEPVVVEKKAKKSRAKKEKPATIDTTPAAKPAKAARVAAPVIEEEDEEEIVASAEEAYEEDEVEEPAPPPLPSKRPSKPAPAVAAKAEPVAKGPTIVAPRADVVKQEPARESDEIEQKGEYVMPPTSLLDSPPSQQIEIDAATLQNNAVRLVQKLEAYGVKGRVDEIHPGPVVTMYELEPESGTKVSKIAGLADDLAMALAAQKVRIVAPIPGKARVGFELPNKHRQTVFLRDILEDRRWEENAEKAALPTAFGKDIAGQPVYGDLAKMPHLLVAGATGAGKSVGLNVMLCSLLMKRTPEEVRMLMIDPKVVELAVFDGIPHMLLPVVTDMKKASLALRWAVDEMERRYQLFADAGARNITTYNERVEKVLRGELAPEKLAPKKAGKQKAIGADGEDVYLNPVDDEAADAVPMPTKLPYVVVVVDEFADLMMVAAKDVEAAIARLAQKARAAGIHVILATQRPSVDVITGMIKANFPARIAFKVSQREDSKTILGRIGAEHLLGQGDMLMIPPGASDLRRVHSAYVSEHEVQGLCDHLREQGKPVYDEKILAPRDEESGEVLGDDGPSHSDDPLYDRAVACVATAGYCSISHIQRQLGIGYNKAAKLVEKMEAEGVVGPATGKAGGRREVLINAL